MLIIHTHVCYMSVCILPDHKEELGIAGYGISVTTMEEVFIKVGEGNDETLQER